ncbi:MAG: hypothetical protein PHG03_01995 [Bacilli bacterium]|nr:hypothetical protein [Bacilli bacterium]
MKINNLCRFLNIENKIINGNILNIEKTNIAYIEPYKLKINNNEYLFFNGSDEVNYVGVNRYYTKKEQDIDIEI